MAIAIIVMTFAVGCIDNTGNEWRTIVTEDSIMLSEDIKNILEDKERGNINRMQQSAQYMAEDAAYALARSKAMTVPTSYTQSKQQYELGLAAAQIAGKEIAVRNYENGALYAYDAARYFQKAEYLMPNEKRE